MRIKLLFKRITHVCAASFLALLVGAGPVAAATTIGANITSDGNLTVNGNVTLGDAAADLITVMGTIQGASPFVFEGTTADVNDLTIAVTNPTAPRTLTLPDVTGTFVTTGDTGSVTNAMLAGSIAASKLVGTDITTVGTIGTGIWNGTTIAIANGGTGATTAGAARTALGLAIGSNVQAHDTDLDAWALVATSAKQNADTDLNTIAGLSVSDGNFIVGNGMAWVAETGAIVRTSLGLGSLAEASTINNANWSGTALSVGNGGTGATTATLGFNALAPTQTGNSGKFLSTDATNTAWTTLTKTMVGLGNVENTALTGWAGSTSITTLGTIATGVWSGTAVAVAKGGTGQSSYTAGDLLYATGATATSKLGIGTANKFLTSSGSAPQWSTNLIGVTNITIANGSDRTLAIAAAPVTTAGNHLNISAGNGTGAGDYAGGVLYLKGGAPSGSGTPGYVVINQPAGATPDELANFTQGSLFIEGMLEVDGNARLDGHFAKSVAAGVSAAGGTQGTATVIATDIVEVTSITNTTAEGVILPAATAGTQVTIVITSAASASLEIYPHSGGTVNGGTSDVSYNGTYPQYSTVTCSLLTSTYWDCTHSGR